MKVGLFERVFITLFFLLEFVLIALKVIGYITCSWIWIVILLYGFLVYLFYTLILSSEQQDEEEEQKQ